MLLAIDCLPKGGTINITANESVQTEIRASGEDVGFKEDVLAALSLDIAPEKLDPKIIHPYITGLMAKSYRFGISAREESSDFIVLTLTSPDDT